MIEGARLFWVLQCLGQNKRMVFEDLSEALDLLQFLGDKGSLSRNETEWVVEVKAWQKKCRRSCEPA